MHQDYSGVNPTTDTPQTLFGGPIKFSSHGNRLPTEKTRFTEFMANSGGYQPSHSENGNNASGSVIKKINCSIDNQRDLAEQRQDVFDPHGKADWGAGGMGGFLTGQINVNEAHATERELKQQTDQSDGVSKLKQSGAFQ